LVLAFFAAAVSLTPAQPLGVATGRSAATSAPTLDSSWGLDAPDVAHREAPAAGMGLAERVGELMSAFPRHTASTSSFLLN
jgi:hypothetical protein